MKNLIIGNGEVGKALQEVFDCDIRDLENTDFKDYDVIHVAFPYSKKFMKEVKEYQRFYKPKYTVIHSTVPVGTSDKLGANHSPVTGVHPKLAESIKTFTKFIGGKDSSILAEEFQKYGINAVAVLRPEETEAGKLYNLLTYGINILIEKEIHKFCVDNGLDYNVVYKDFVKMYNEGYEKLGMNHIKMYELEHKEGGIGGHCIIKNGSLLKTKFSKILKKFNKLY
jgi:hypothetical protein